MNLPNILTVSRIVMAPVFFLLFAGQIPAYLAGDVVSVPVIVVLWVLFFLIELTDIADGFFARRQNLVSSIGKVLDPFADVVSHLTFFLALVLSSLMPGILFLLIMYREIGMIFLRLVMYGKGVALAARVGGKLKTWFYAVASGVGLAAFSWPALGTTAQAYAGGVQQAATVLFAVSATLSLLSFADYLRIAATADGKR